jgi:hypothetical protein
MYYFFFNLHGIKELAEVKWFSWLLAEFLLRVNMFLLTSLFVATSKYLQASGPKYWLLFESSSSGI